MNNLFRKPEPIELPALLLSLLGLAFVLVLLSRNGAEHGVTWVSGAQWGVAALAMVLLLHVILARKTHRLVLLVLHLVLACAVIGAVGSASTAVVVVIVFTVVSQVSARLTIRRSLVLNGFLIAAVASIQVGLAVPLLDILYTLILAMVFVSYGECQKHYREAAVVQHRQISECHLVH